MKFVLFVTLIWSILVSGWSITDEEYIQFKAGLTQIQVVIRENKELRQRVNHLEQELNQGFGHLNERVARLEETCGAVSDVPYGDLAQNTTIEERVTILEAQMTEVQEDLISVDEDIDFLFDEQVIQDERIFNLEEETTDLDSRVEVLEATSGGNVTALQIRVGTLEETATEHEADIADLESTTSNLDGRVETLEGETSELETRLTAAETQIEDLQAFDAELDSRISDLENEMNIAFRAVMNDAEDINIPVDSVVIFSDVQLNQGNGYDPATGVFTVPSGGEGYYYFASYFTVNGQKYAVFDLQVNDVTVSSMYDDNYADYFASNGGLKAVVFLSEGDEVKNVYLEGGDSAPVLEYDGINFNIFTGFRI